MRRLLLVRVARIVCAVCVCGATGALPAAASAQQPSTAPGVAPPVVPSERSDSPSEIPSTPADTGRMQVGWRAFARYDWLPDGGMCETALRTSWMRLWRAAAHDTLPYVTRVGETVPLPATRIGETCGGARLLATSEVQVTAGVSHATFLTWFALALELQQDSLAERLATRHLAHVPAVVDRALLLQSILTIVQTARPLRVPLLEATVARLDGLGTTPDTVLRARADGHRALVAHWLQIGDVGRLRTEIETALSLIAATTSFSTDTSDTDLLYELLAHVTVFEGGPADARLDSVLQRWQRARPTSRARDVVAAALAQYGHPFALPDDRDSTMWFAPDDTAAGTTSIPGFTQQDSVPRLRPDRATLVVSLPDYACGEERDVTECYRQYAALQRIQARYSARGLDLVVLARTKGYAPTGVQTQLPSWQEALEIRTYLQDHWHLRVTLGVLATPFAHPDETGLGDGSLYARRINGTPVWDTSSVLHTAPTFLLDRRGHLQRVGVLPLSLADDESLLDRFIQRVLTDESSAVSPQPRSAGPRGVMHVVSPVL